MWGWGGESWVLQEATSAVLTLPCQYTQRFPLSQVLTSPYSLLSLASHTLPSSKACRHPKPAPFQTFYPDSLRPQKKSQLIYLECGPSGLCSPAVSTVSGKSCHLSVFGDTDKAVSVTGVHFQTYGDMFFRVSYEGIFIICGMNYLRKISSPRLFPYLWCQKGKHTRVYFLLWWMSHKVELWGLGSDLQRWWLRNGAE